MTRVTIRQVVPLGEIVAVSSVEVKPSVWGARAPFINPSWQMSSTPSAHVLTSITALARGSRQLLQLLRAKFSPLCPAAWFSSTPFRRCNFTAWWRLQNALGMIHTWFSWRVCYTGPAQTNITELTDGSAGHSWLKENVWRRAECGGKCESKVLSCFCRASAAGVSGRKNKCLFAKTKGWPALWVCET